MSTNETNVTTPETTPSPPTPLPRSSSNSTAAHTAVDSDTTTKAKTTNEKTDNDTVEDGEAENEADAIIVDWDGPNDPQNPKKYVQNIPFSNIVSQFSPNSSWSFGRKWAATAIVSAFTFISPVSSSMVAPATDVIASQFGITNEVLIAMTTSIFILAYG